MLKSTYTGRLIEAGCDEAGRGCLAGPVFAAAVIFPADYCNTFLNDSKKLTPGQRDKLRRVIEDEAVSWAVAAVDHEEIDRINILNASILAMHKALGKLSVTPELILVDSNRIKNFNDITHETIVKGDGLYLSIAAASVLAKTHRDEYMKGIHDMYPEYRWNRNMGYPTLEHRKAVMKLGFSPYHRRTFSVQLKVWE
jgi:ribonuclease HII